MEDFACVVCCWFTIRYESVLQQALLWIHAVTDRKMLWYMCILLCVFKTNCFSKHSCQVYLLLEHSWELHTEEIKCMQMKLFVEKLQWIIMKINMLGSQPFSQQRKTSCLWYSILFSVLHSNPLWTLGRSWDAWQMFLVTPYAAHFMR